MNDGVWQCFHCDETFTTTEGAIEHFGRTERQVPACLIDIKEYRAMEQRMLAYNGEDADIHRELQGKLSAHRLALVREEERGYDRGLRDAKRFPETLGLMHAPKPVVGGAKPMEIRQIGLFTRSVHDADDSLCFHYGESDAKGTCEILDAGVTGGPYVAYPAYICQETPKIGGANADDTIHHNED